MPEPTTSRTRSPALEFVFAAKQGNVRQARSFTPAQFEEMAGIVPVRIAQRGGRLWCELTAPEPWSLGSEVSLKEL